MLKKIGLFCFLISALSFYATAQKEIDSLESNLHKKLSDSLHIETLLQLSSAYQYSDLKKSIAYSHKAAEIAETKDLLRQKVKSYLRLATLSHVSGDFVSSAKYNDLALSISYQLKDTITIAKAYNNLGLSYSSFGKYDEAYFYFTQCYQLSKIKKDSFLLAVALHNISTVFKNLGQYDRALDYLQHTQKISNIIKDEEGAAYNYNEVGDIFRRKKLYDTALQTLKYSLKSTRQIRLTYNDLVSEILMNIAKVYFDKKDDDNAQLYYDSAYQIYAKIGNEYGIAQVHLGRGRILASEKKYEEALKLMKSSLMIANRTNSWALEIECYQSLATLYEQQGDTRNALNNYKHYNQLEDSLFSEGMQAKLLQDQVRFETASKEDQIKTLNKLEEVRKEELKKEVLIRNILVVAIALTVILLFAVYRSGQRRITINKLLVEHQGEIKKRNKELEQLNEVKDKFFSIISHDLRSPMNALSGILDLMDNNQIRPEEFSRLNKELRKQFDHTKTLINNLLDWALLQMDKLKLQPDKFDLQKMVDENFKMLASLHLKNIKMINGVASNLFGFGDLNMVNLILRNLILNGIKFTESGGLIEVTAKEQDKEIVVSVKDTGIGINPAVQKILFEKTAGYTTRGTANEKGTGLGLLLCKEFVEKNGGRIWLESEVGKGSTFYFTIKKG